MHLLQQFFIYYFLNMPKLVMSPVQVELSSTMDLTW